MKKKMFQTPVVQESSENLSKWETHTLSLSPFNQRYQVIICVLVDSDILIKLLLDLKYFLSGEKGKILNDLLQFLEQHVRKTASYFPRDNHETIMASTLVP